MIISLNQKEILEVQQNKPPYLLIDYVDELVPGSYAKGYKDFGPDEWFFKVHWQGDPNMPGMLQVEAMVQMSSLIIFTLPNINEKTLYLANATNIKFFKKIIPGDKLEILSKLVSSNRGLYKFEAEGYVKKKIACKADFTLILPGSVYISPNKNKLTACKKK